MLVLDRLHPSKLNKNGITKMTLQITQGDLLRQEVDAIVNTVNCVGVMGKGIALQFKQKWPENYKAYEKACKAKKVQTGKMFVHELGRLAGKPYFIINFPTKNHWRGKSELSYVKDGLQDLVDVIKKNNIRSIAIPPLGCGNGGLDWNEVNALIKQYLSPLGDALDVRLFEPKGAPASDKMIVHTKKPRMTIGRAILIKLIAAYRGMGYSLSKIEIQKLCYFAYVKGEMSKLNYHKDQYGPFANNLRYVLDHMNGHYICGVGDHDTSEAQITLMDNAIIEADDFLGDNLQTSSALDSISALIEGFESPYGMELLATVHWASVNDVKSIELDRVVGAVHNWEPTKPEWNERKKTLMKEEHIHIALDRLVATGWVNHT